MVRQAVFLIACCGVFLSPAIAQPTRMISAAAAKEDAALARRAIELIHPGLDRYTTRAKIGGAFERLAMMCEHDVTEQQFYGELSLVLATLRCSHTKAEPSQGWSEWRANTPSYLPFRFVEHDGRMIVTKSACSGLQSGDEIVRIDGVSGRAVLARIFDAVPADGWTDDARKFALSTMSDLDESEVDHFLPAFFSFGESVRLEVRRDSEPTTRTMVALMMTRQARLAALAEPPAAKNLDEAVSLDIRPGGIAVLRIDTFVAYRKPIKPVDIYRPHFERIAAERTQTLILDLRDNGGGSDSAANDLMRFLVDSPYKDTTKQWVRTYRFGDLTDRLETWDRSVLSMPDEAFKNLGNGYFEVIEPDVAAPGLPPHTPTFAGRIIVLCGPANASGATLFMAELRARRQVVLLGEATGGNAAGPTAGVILFLPLPNTGIKVRIPAIRSVTGLANADERGGLTPDVLVRRSLEDTLSGRDIVLERALEVAKEK